MAMSHPVEWARPISTAEHDEAGKIFDSRVADRQRAIRVALFLSTQRRPRQTGARRSEMNPQNGRHRPSLQLRRPLRPLLQHLRPLPNGQPNPRPMIDRRSENLPRLVEVVAG
jgi:hypothetical protein